MTFRSLPWPKLTGIVVGLECLAIFMSQARLLFWSSQNTGWPEAGTTWLTLLFATFLALLAYFVYRAHNWAPLTLIGLCLCLCALAVCQVIAAEVAWAHMMAGSNEWTWRHQIESVIDSVGLHLALLAPIAFVIGALCHPDVAATFRSKTRQ